MGQQVAARVFSREDRQRYREKVRANLDVFARMLAEARFDPEVRSFGLEIELNLTDEAGDPALVNAAVLEAIANPDFQTELSQFNVEINVAPHLFGGRVLSELESGVRGSLNGGEERARTVGAHMMIIGILPTVEEKHLNAESFSESPRYALLNEQIFAARGEDLHLSISGVERLSTYADTIAPEAACTSVQLHQQVRPENFAACWNAAQAIAGVQVAIGANSPFFFGRELWRETRIALFEQATDTRPEELKAQGVRPRVWFGERWITSIFDLFEENVRYFPALLPVCEDEDPERTLDGGGVPQLGELRLHNGTVYRWNRPIYDVVWRTACCPPDPPWWTRWPTPPSTTGWCGCSPRTSARCGRGCPSRPPRRTSTRARGTASKHGSTGPAWARCRPPSWSSASCFRSRTRGSTAGGSIRRIATACSTSSSVGAWR
jgi:hypothetical protein